MEDIYIYIQCEQQLNYAIKYNNKYERTKIINYQLFMVHCFDSPRPEEK